MELKKWHYYIFVNCALLYYGAAKPFSLNEVIAAESQQKQVAETRNLPELKEAATKRFSLKKALKHLPLKSKNLKETGILSLSKKISPLKYRKTFQIQSPLRPKRIKNNLGSRQKRRNQSVKREISGNEKLNPKYIPLFRSIGMLFDDFLGTDSSESVKIKTRKRKRVGYNRTPAKTDETSCSCPSKTVSKAEVNSHEKADSFSEALSSEITFATTAASETTNITTASNKSGIGPNKNVSILFPRNTFGSRRNNNGLDEGSSAAHHGSSEGHLSRNYGNSKHNTRNRKNETNAQSDQNYSSSDTRDNASGDGTRSRLRGSENSTEDSIEGDAINEDGVSKNKDEISNEDDRGYANELEADDKYEIGRNETKSEESLRESVRRSRQFSTQNEDNTLANSVQTEEIPKFYITQNLTSHQQFIDRSSRLAKENKTISQGNKTITEIPVTSRKKKQGPVVVIIDGYSVTRHKNGENKLSEKAIRIHSK